MFPQGIQFNLEILKLTVLKVYKFTELKSHLIESKLFNCSKEEFCIIVTAIEKPFYKSALAIAVKQLIFLLMSGS